MEKYLQKFMFFVLFLLLIAFPFFFLNTTQEFFITNKLYLLGFGALLLLLLSAVHLLLTKKLSWEKRPFDNFILLFLTTMAISIIFSSPNKIQALLNPNFGLVMMFSLVVLYFYLSRSFRLPPIIYHLSSIILSLITVVFYFQPFKNIALPQNLAFLKNPSFTPVGSQLDLVIFLGFFVFLGISHLLTIKKSSGEVIKQKIFNFILLIFNLVALSLTVYSLIRVNPLQLPPFRLSWFAALEILKNPQTALFGIGLGNFSSVFTQVKDLAYNQSPLWQIYSFNVSRSVILQIFTEAGILGLLTFGLLVIAALRQLITKSALNSHGFAHSLPFIYLFICLFVFPPSLVVWFLFFVVLSMINHTSVTDVRAHHDTPLQDLLPIYVGFVVISFGLIGVFGYFLGRSYVSEYYFKKSLDGIVSNDVKQVYDNQRQAVILNPYIERFRSSFSQTNLLIANNLAQKDPKEITEQDRQTITQAIQAAISEGKAVVSLNSQRADGWQNLASIYLSVINAAQGADAWTISAYQRAILADPQNPIYRVSLGGVYYSLEKYDDALRFFEQAISLKPDWPNASYNFAWANFQKKNYAQAVNAMQNVLSLLDQKLNKSDFEKAQKDLEEFKKMLPKEGADANTQKEAVVEPGSLNLPTPPVTQISPKLELPKEASPEAK